MGQFFVMKKYRRLGVGTLGARFIFDQCRGRWEVGQMPLNRPAQAFWRRAIGDYTNGISWNMNCTTNAGTAFCNVSTTASRPSRDGHDRGSLLPGELKRWIRCAC